MTVVKNIVIRKAIIFTHINILTLPCDPKLGFLCKISKPWVRAGFFTGEQQLEVRFAALHPQRRDGDLPISRAANETVLSCRKSSSHLLGTCLNSGSPTRTLNEQRKSTLDLRVRSTRSAVQTESVHFTADV